MARLPMPATRRGWGSGTDELCPLVDSRIRLGKSLGSAPDARREPQSIPDAATRRRTFITRWWHGGYAGSEEGESQWEEGGAEGKPLVFPISKKLKFMKGFSPRKSSGTIEVSA